MTNNPFFSDEFAKVTLDAGLVLLNNGVLRIYDGAQPTDSNTAVGAQNLLGTFTFGATAFAASTVAGAAPNRKATAVANAIANITAALTGTATWFRALKTGGSAAIMDGTVGLSGCDLNLTDVTLTVGETMSVSSLSVSNPE